jgi:hypothetical protein
VSAFERTLAVPRFESSRPCAAVIFAAVSGYLAQNREFPIAHFVTGALMPTIGAHVSI